MNCQLLTKRVINLLSARNGISIDSIEGGLKVFIRATLLILAVIAVIPQN